MKIKLITSAIIAPAQAPAPAQAQATGRPLGTIGTPTGFQPDITSPGAPVEKIFSSLLAVFTIIGGLMFIIYFILAAIRWLTAGDKAEQAEKARTQMTNALLGLVVLVASYALFYIVGLVLGLNILEPASIIKTLKP